MTFPENSHLKPAKTCVVRASITHAAAFLQFMALLAWLCFACIGPAVADGGAKDAELEQFKKAWAAAGRGDHDSFEKIANGLRGYLLYPYLQYEDYVITSYSIHYTKLYDGRQRQYQHASRPAGKAG